MAARRGAESQLNVSLPAGTADELRCVIAYEAGMRNRSLGLTVFDLVMAVADTGSYPEAVRRRLGELEREIELAAVERSLSGGGEWASASGGGRDQEER